MPVDPRKLGAGSLSIIERVDIWIWEGRGEGAFAKGIRGERNSRRMVDCLVGFSCFVSRRGTASSSPTAFLPSRNQSICPVQQKEIPERLRFKCKNKHMQAYYSYTLRLLANV